MTVHQFVFVNTPERAAGHDFDVVVVGGGQAALALGFYLRRTPLSWIILDDQPAPGGSWGHGWRSLRAFSPAQWSSLPGWQMPRSGDEYPTRDDVLAYLAEYERRYALPVRRRVRVTSVERDGERLAISATSQAGVERWRARAMISATGGAPFIPDIRGLQAWLGLRIHSSVYASPDGFAGKRVVVVGGGNSGAQIVADLTDPKSQVENVTWATLDPPRFLPDDVDGRVLFDQATARYKAQQAGLPPPPARSLGDIVVVAPVRAARDRGDLRAVRMFDELDGTAVHWPDNAVTQEDAIIWATGFRPALAHLSGLNIVNASGRCDVGGPAGTRSIVEPRVWLVGYGNWTGYASATLIGIGRSARATVDEIQYTGG